MIADTISKTILYVDDEPLNLKIFQAMCEGEFDVLLAENVETALEILATKDIAVLLADQRMPRQSGVDLLEMAASQCPHTVRILITAYSDLDAAINAINRGKVRRYLRKPWLPKQLKMELREAINFYQLTKKLEGLESRLIETERLYALGLVVSAVGHELRNPLGWVKWNVDFARVELHKLSDQGAFHDGLIQNKVTAIGAALDDAQHGVLQIEKVIEGIELPTLRRTDENTDPGETLTTVLRIAKHKIECVACLNLTIEEVPRVLIPSTKLSQVFLNLAVNAAQALTGHGPARSNTISIRLAVEAGMVLFEVQDSGLGFEEQHLARLFDPFFTTKDGVGTGLGLAISKRIVEEYGGTIDASNAPTGGALMRVLLPVHTTAPKL